MWGAIAGVGALLGSTLISNHSAKKEAQKNRDFQEYMSNTSISRRMQDLRNAGLNPLLAVDNASAGASTPSGSQAQLQSFDPSWITALSNAKLQKQQEKVAKAEERKVNAEAVAQEQDNNIFEFKAEKMRLEAERERQGVLNDKIMNEILNAKNENERLEIYKKSLEAKGIDISNKKASEELRILLFRNDKEIDLYKNNPDLPTVEKLGEITTNPYNSLGVGMYYLDNLVNGSARFLRNIFKKNSANREKEIEKRGYEK